MLRIFMAILIAAALSGCVIWPGDYGDRGGGYGHEHERDDHRGGDGDREGHR